MKTVSYLALLALTLVPSSQATTILLSSLAATTTNDSGNATVNITRHPAWADPMAGSSWISTASTGDPSAPGYVNFHCGTS
ncbi:MAG: hypothetical protein ABI822_28480, partial [Bryobacteraceae bacterium]